VIFAVLIVIVVLSLVGYRFADSMTGEYRAGVRLGDAAQVKMAAISGLHYTAAMLSDPTTLSSQLSGNPFDNESTFGEVQLTASGGTGNPNRPPCFSIRSVAVNDDGSYSPHYGVIDEGGKLNINSLIGIDPTGQVLYNALLSLQSVIPDMTTDIADAIVDWVDADDTPRATGVESSYYQSLSPSYSAKNGPLNSLDELLLVKGVTPYILYGGDTNRNGVQDPGEVDATRGLSDYITIYGREINVSSSGTQRIYLNNSDLATLFSQLTEAVGGDMATYIMAAKLYSTSAVSASGGNQSQAATPSQIAATVQTAMSTAISNGQSGSQIQSLMDLIGTQVSVPQTGANGQNAAPLVVPSPLNDASQLQTLLPLLMDQTTVKQAIELVPRININTAPLPIVSAILATVPSLPATLATTISTQRASNVATDTGTITAAWLVTSNTLTPAQFKSLEAYITGSTMIYRVQSIGYFKGTVSNNSGGATGPMARMEAVVDTNQGAPRFLFMRDLSDLDTPRGFVPTQ